MYLAANLPPGAGFRCECSKLEWTPAFGAAGTYPDVVITVSDGVFQVSQDVTIVIAPNPQPPTLARPADVTGRGRAHPVYAEGHRWDAALTYSSSMLPPGAVLNPNTGVFTWTPDFTEQGLYNVPFTVSDGQASTTQSTVLVVTHADAAPVFENLTNFQVLENQQLEFSAHGPGPQ